MVIIRYFPDMFYGLLNEVGISIPENHEKFDFYEYVHYNVFMNVSLGYAYHEWQHEHNAKIIASIPHEKLNTMTVEGLINLGCEFTQSSYID